MGTQIVDWSMSLPTTWASWPPHEGAVHAGRVADLLADSDDGRAAVARAVRELDAGLPDGPVLTAGLWVPDRASGQPLGTVVAEILVGVPEGPEPVETFAASVQQAPKRRGLKTFSYSASVADLPAGPTAVREWQWADKSDGIVVCQSIWTLIPPGASEALQVTFTTRTPAMVDALAIDAWQAVQTLAVVLGEVA
ncbi:hypothetical protein [Cellulomonas sp.]|uniref:hypothetical protein n=1 Tax=Cellulomonas sp. TaxID=40001 RepID=UPI001AFE9E70|nr:hypothetical protein [Cellulomonas sp.]MBO9556332.1 hypothetical protein [Cellulomonas sp.]